jgi:hypothetical protein
MLLVVRIAIVTFLQTSKAPAVDLTLKRCHGAMVEETGQDLGLEDLRLQDLEGPSVSIPCNDMLELGV